MRPFGQIPTKARIRANPARFQALRENQGRRPITSFHPHVGPYAVSPVYPADVTFNILVSDCLDSPCLCQ
jgi:hypothetical protein